MKEDEYEYWDRVDFQAWRQEMRRHYFYEPEHQITFDEIDLILEEEAKTFKNLSDDV